MKNLYNKIYEAIDNGIQKALIIDNGQAKDVSVKWNEHAITNNFNPVDIQLTQLLTSENRLGLDIQEPKKVYKEIIRRYEKEGFMYTAENYYDLKSLIYYIITYVSVKANLNWIDVTRVTNMKGLCSACIDMHGNPLSGNWKDITMPDGSYWYHGWHNFNCDISKWDVSNVTNMQAMFAWDPYFDCDISDWDVSNVEYFNQMFQECKHFNQPIGKWNIKSATSLFKMFTYCYMFNQPLNNWNTKNIIVTQEMFKRCLAFNQPLDNWDLLWCRRAANMFESCKSFNQDLSSWKLINCDTKNMFKNCNIDPSYYPKNLKI